MVSAYRHRPGPYRPGRRVIIVHDWPTFSGEDNGDGGVRRVVEALHTSLPRLRVQFTDDPGSAQLIACHISAPPEYYSRFPDKPIVAHCHGLYWSEYEWERWAYKANRDVLKLITTADAVTAPSEWVSQIIRRHTSRPVTTLYHGVSAREWQPSSTHRGYVLWNKTRPDPVCSPESLNQLVRAMPNQPFVSTFGDEAPNINIIGRVSYAASKELVRNAGVYLTTTRETFGIGTLEAMASAVPVVGYAYGAQVEYIEHGVDGWLVEPGDIDGLAEGVRWALANREEVGQAALAKARQFSWAAAAERYHDLYRDVIQESLAAEKRPRTSVVITAYGLERYLPAALDSVLAQDDQSFEVVVVDDASPDASGAIADRYAAADPRVTVIHNAANVYLAEARNIGIDAARGRYILPLDADDQLGPKAISTLADALDADRTLDVAYGRVLFTDEDGATPTNYGVPGRAPGHSNWPFPWDGEKQLQGFNLLPYASAFRRRSWEAVGGYRRRLRTAEDADFWTRLASWGHNFRLVTEADTLIYRNRPESMSNSNRAREHDYSRWYPWSRQGDLAPAGSSGPENVSLCTPHVSVVIPVGPGHGQHVQAAVDSVSAQSYKFWEVIVVNDSGEKLRLPSWVQVVESDKRDPGGSRNLGIAQAKGEFYLALDADDYLQPNCLQWLISGWIELNRDEKVDERHATVYSDFFEDPNDEGVWNVWELPDWRAHEVTQRVSHTVTALTPVEVWKAVGGYAEGMGWEDWDFQFRCVTAGFCAHRVAAPLFTYRKHTGHRRNYTRDDFEARKSEILAKWGEVYSGRQPVMACGCSQRTITPSGSAPLTLGKSQYPDAVLVTYTGKKSGSVRFKGAATGAFYDFARGDPPKWVRGHDVDTFVTRSDFSIEVTPAQEVSSVGTAQPILVAHA